MTAHHILTAEFAKAFDLQTLINHTVHAQLMLHMALSSLMHCLAMFATGNNVMTWSNGDARNA